ncbi:MAG TPA: hypothetical protein VND92_10680 [Vicinamibacterales bacterium]|nr:hypothetical protein [Vicinamibacterales bacterium]
MRRLREAIDRISDALAGLRLDDLLAAEPVLAAALEEAGRYRPGPAERPAVIVEIGQARQALQRCLRLGETLNEAARILRTARGLTVEYGRDGREQGPSTPATVEARA